VGVADPAFAGFGPAAFAWFAGLEAENTREWFRSHRATFDAEVRRPFGALLDELAAEDGGEVKVFRQHRDLRFARDKTPYKTRTYGVITGRGTGAARYVALQPHYNLMERDSYEGAPRALCEREGLACVPYYGLARGFLTGKYRPGAPAVASPRAEGVRAST